MNELKDVMSLLQIPGFINGLDVVDSFQREAIKNTNSTISMLPLFNSKLISVNNILNNEKFSSLDNIKKLKYELQNFINQYEIDNDYDALRSNLNKTLDGLYGIVDISRNNIKNYQISNIENLYNSNKTKLPGFVLNEIKKYNDFESFLTNNFYEKSLEQLEDGLLYIILI